MNDPHVGKSRITNRQRDVMLQLGKLQCIITCSKRHSAFSGITLYVPFVLDRDRILGPSCLCMRTHVNTHIIKQGDSIIYDVCEYHKGEFKRGCRDDAMPLPCVCWWLLCDVLVADQPRCMATSICALSTDLFCCNSLVSFYSLFSRNGSLEPIYNEKDYARQ